MRVFLVMCMELENIGIKHVFHALTFAGVT